MKHASLYFRLFVLLLTIGLLIGDQQPAHAYLDPGTGSYAAQVVLAGVLVALFSLRTLFTQLIARVGSLLNRNSISIAGKKAAE